VRRANLKFFKPLVFLLSFQFFLSVPTHAAEKENALFQVSTINALLGGVLEGTVDFKTLKEKGDFGIGTFHELDGEMIALDGVFYQIKADGTVSVATDDMKTPFCSITFFKPQETLRLDGPFVLKDFAGKLDPLLATPNLIYAVRIDGTFDYIKTRSVPRQNKPYPNLTEVVKTQPVFEFQNVQGTIVGFRFPEYMQDLNVPSYHFHFITQDRKGGGHILDWNLTGAEVKISSISDFRMVLPHNAEFYEINLSQDTKLDLMKVER